MRLSPGLTVPRNGRPALSTNFGYTSPVFMKVSRSLPPATRPLRLRTDGPWPLPASRVAMRWAKRAGIGMRWRRVEPARRFREQEPLAPCPRILDF